MTAYNSWLSFLDQMRCLEHALYQRELEDVTVALEDLEGERADEVHNANERRERFSGREQNIHVCSSPIPLHRILT